MPVIDSKPVVDPIKFCEECWPNITLFDKQREILRSVRDNDETFVPAGNMLGKDFVAAVCALWFFTTKHPVRVLTTSVKDEHLDVLWGEIDQFLRTSKHGLIHGKGGILVYNHHEIRKMIDGRLDQYSYLKGTVSKRGEGLSGHHAKHTLLIVDEASGVEDVAYNMTTAWAQKVLVIGNPHPCANFFFSGVKGGNIESPVNEHLYRKVIRIRAEDSPSVRLGLAQAKTGKPITDEELIPGVLKYSDYKKRRALWDSIRRCIGLDGEFYEGPETLLYPPEWLNRAEQIADGLQGKSQPAETIGVDSAEGGDNTAWAVVGRKSLIKLISKKTPDTSVITGETLALMKQYRVEPGNVLFDAGGGGRQHGDRLRRQGYSVRMIPFGGSPTPERHRGMQSLGKLREQDETRWAYKNRKAEMFGLLRSLLDPDINSQGFGLPAEYSELRRQLAPIPMDYDDQGRLQLPPKGAYNVATAKSFSKPTMIDLIGHSPDEADALVLAVFGMLRKVTTFKVRSMV